MKIGAVTLSIGFMAFSIMLFYMSLDFNPGMGGDVGSGVFPRVIAGIAVACCAAIILSELKKGSMDKVLNSSVRKAIALGALVLGYVFVMEIVGFVIATPIVILMFLYIMKQRRHVVNVAFAFGLTALTYYAFGVLFHVRIPQTFLGF